MRDQRVYSVIKFTGNTAAVLEHNVSWNRAWSTFDAEDNDQLTAYQRIELHRDGIPVAVVVKWIDGEEIMVYRPARKLSSWNERSSKTRCGS